VDEVESVLKDSKAIGRPIASNGRVFSKAGKDLEDPVDATLNLVHVVKAPPNR
jgi:hypothetical protein